MRRSGAQVGWLVGYPEFQLLMKADYYWPGEPHAANLLSLPGAPRCLSVPLNRQWQI